MNPYSRHSRLQKTMASPVRARRRAGKRSAAERAGRRPAPAVSETGPERWRASDRDLLDLLPSAPGRE